MRYNRFRLASVLMLLCALLSGTLGGSHIRASDLDDFIPGEVLVELARTDDLADVAADYQLDPTPIDQFGSRPIYRLQMDATVSPRSLAVALEADPFERVVHAEPNYRNQAPEGQQRVSWARAEETGDYAEQWAPETIRLSEAHTVSRGAGVTVAVLDTGVDLSHPALEGRLVPGFDFVDMDSDPSETGEHGTNMAYGHGTHVAGLVALVAPEAKIMPVRVLDPDGVGNLWVLAEGLQYAFDPDGDPTTHDGADVINLSLGTRRQTGILAALVRRVACDAEQDGEYCRSPDRRAVIVAAAGNSGGSRLEYPAAEPVPGLLSVAATTQNDRLARFSTRASWVSVSAPGTDIVSSVPNGGYGSWSGTSMATPLVAGEAALIRSAYPRMSPRAVVSRIRGRARDIDGAPPRIDVAAALGIPRAP